LKNNQLFSPQLRKTTDLEAEMLLQWKNGVSGTFDGWNGSYFLWQFIQVWNTNVHILCIICMYVCMVCIIVVQVQQWTSAALFPKR
jgi:hypothetical protein